MPMPYLSAHVIDDTGETRGTYEHIPCKLSNIQKGHLAVEVEQSLFEGDRMTFYQILTSRDSELDRMRPIRFYTENGGTKIFDGVVIDTEYAYIGADYMALRCNAAGWWRELARMNFHQPIEYDGDWCVNDIYLDLVRRANDMGVMKEALYKYDTDKIPEYGTYEDAYKNDTNTTLVFNNVYEGMKTLTRFLDIADATCAYEFGLRVESLPRAAVAGSCDAISAADCEDSIYILPFPLNQDKDEEATFKKFQLTSGYNVRRDYRQLANDCFAVGDGYVTQQIHPVPILSNTPILTDPDQFVPDRQPKLSHYLRVTIDNSNGVPVHGRVEIEFDDGTIDILKFDLSLAPAGTHSTQIQYTSVRGVFDTLPCYAITAHDLNWAGVSITIDEVTNEFPAFYTTIAGKSINTYGRAPKTIEGLWLNTQARVNYAAGKHCRLYHAPSHSLYAPVHQRYVSYNNLIGNTAKFYSPYTAQLESFLVTGCVYGFVGTRVSQYLLGKQYSYDWDYEGTNIYVFVELEHVYVGSEKVTL